MRCAHCGSDNPEKLKYCIKCGKPLDPSRKAGAVAEAGEAEDATSTQKLSRAEKKAAKARQRTKEEAAKRVSERAAGEVDDGAVKRAQERRAARRAATGTAAAGQGAAGHAAEGTVATKSPKARQRKGAAATAMPTATGTTIPAEGEESRAAVLNYAVPEKKKSHKGAIAAVAAVAALAAGGAWFAVNGNPFDANRTATQPTSSIAQSSSASTVGSNASSVKPTADAADFDNGVVQVTLPERWKGKVAFEDANGTIAVKDQESGANIATIYTGQAPEEQLAGRSYDLGKATVNGQEEPVTMFVPNVDDQGAAIQAGSEADVATAKSALEHYLNATPSTFVSYLKLKQGSDFKTASIQSGNGSLAASSTEPSNTESGAAGTEGTGTTAATGDGSATGGTGDGASGAGATGSTGGGYTIAPAEGNADYSGGSTSGELPTQSANTQPAPEPTPAPAPEPTPAPEPAPAPEPTPAPAPAANDGSTPFWGVWIGAFKSEENAYKRVAEAKAAGMDATVYVSNEWTNLNQNRLYVVTVGNYSDEAAARDVLTRAKTAGFTDAYVKHTGDKK